MVAAMTWDDYPYRVRSSRLVTPVIRKLYLNPDATALPHRPGQYVLLSDRDFQVPQRTSRWAARMRYIVRSEQR